MGTPAPAPPRHRVSVSAPGKLILMGEHAAVYGHPALVAAIDLRLVVTATAQVETEEPGVELELPQLGYCGLVPWSEIWTATDSARVSWRRQFGDATKPAEGPAVESMRRPARDTTRATSETVGVTPAQLVQLALGEASRRLGESLDSPDLHPASLRLRIDSELPVGAGFGSSASLAVAVAAAYGALRGREFDRPTLLELSLDVERRQHGTPSGIDNAAVLYGGLLWAEPNPAGPPTCEPLSAYSPLLGCFQVFHSGAPGESTGVVVGAVRRKLEQAPEVIHRAFDVIGSCTRTLLRYLEDGATRQDTARLIRRCGHALESLGVVPEPIRELIRRIEQAGGAAKISGAGSLTGTGAGSILVFHPEPEVFQENSFLQSWRKLPIQFPAPGLVLEAIS